MRAPEFRRYEFWDDAERECRRNREMKREIADSFEYPMVRGSLRRGRSSSQGGKGVAGAGRSSLVRLLELELAFHKYDPPP